MTNDRISGNCQSTISALEFTKAGGAVRHAVRQVLDLLTRPWVPLFLWRAEMASAGFPKPEGAQEVRVDGPDPDRILALGGGLLVGYGVLSHDLGLMGHLARQVSHTTGRGVSLDIVARPDVRLGDLPLLLGDRDLSSYDAVIIAAGVTDALKRTRVAAWRRVLVGLIEEIRSHAAVSAQIFVVGVQPVRLVTKLNNPVGLFAELHGRLLDRESARVCAGASYTTFVPFLPEPVADDRYRSSQTYLRWSQQIAPAVGGGLLRSHPTGDAMP